MDIIKAFSLDDKEYPIHIQGTVGSPLFQANQIGKLLGIKNIYHTIQDYSSDEKVVEKSCTSGGIQTVLFLTETGLYKILSRSNKPIAKTFQNWMVDVIKELRQTGEYRLKQEHELEKKLIKTQEQTDAKKRTHDTLMEFCKNKNVVYICKLRDEADDKFIIKIGSTQNVKERFANIKNDYKMVPLLLNIFDCENHTKFEKWVRNTDLLKSVCYPIKKEDGIITRETFLVNEEQYTLIVGLLQKEIKQFVREDVEKLLELERERSIAEENRSIAEDKRRINIELELQLEELRLKQEELRLQQEMIRLRLKENNTPSDTEVVPENTVLSNTPVTEESSELCYIRNRENTRSPLVYQYDPVTLEHVKTFDSIIAVTRHISGSSTVGLKDAFRKNHVYKEYRWMLCSRDVTEPPVPPPTVESRTQSIEYIAMIDIKKTKIMEVYACQRDAALAREMKGYSTISRAIAQGSISSGHYWNHFHKCSTEMQEEFLKHNSLPEPHVKINSTSVIQIDPITNEKVKTHKSIAEVVKKFQMSRTSLNKFSETGEVHHGFKWKIVHTPPEP